MLGLTRGHRLWAGSGGRGEQGAAFFVATFPFPPSVAAGCADSCPEGGGAALVCFGLLPPELRGVPVLHKPCPHPRLLRSSESTLTVLLFLRFLLSLALSLSALARQV